MSRGLTLTEWERQAEALTVEPDPVQTCCPEVDGLDHLAVSRRLIARAASAARRLITAQTCHSGDRISELTGSHDACRLARDLARLARTDLATGADPVLAYLRTLRDLTHAVYYCRRIAHAGGHCWFAPPGSAEQPCRQVLAVAHRLGQRVVDRDQARADQTGAPR